MYDSYKNLAIRILFYDCKMHEMLFNLLLKGMNRGFVSINYIVVNRSLKKIKLPAKMFENMEWLGGGNKKNLITFQEMRLCFEQAIVKQLPNM
jgi:hypothetical protein